VAQLFIWSFLCSSLNGYPIAVMAEDAWLGYIQFEMAWGGGPGKVFGGGANYDGVAQKEEFGYNRNKKGTQGWVKWLAEDLGPTKIPGFAMHCFFSHLSFFDRISRPGNKNNVFRKGWFNRLMNWPNSDLNMCIIVNELFNKNVSGMFEFDDKEKEFLTQKAKIYDTLVLYIPDTI